MGHITNLTRMFVLEAEEYSPATERLPPMPKALGSMPGILYTNTFPHTPMQPDFKN